jgi:hypothetical protein
MKALSLNWESKFFIKAIFGGLLIFTLFWIGVGTNAWAGVPEDLNSRKSQMLADDGLVWAWGEV